MYKMRSTKLACAAVVLLTLGVVDNTLTNTGNFKLRSRISEKEVLAAQEAWGEALVSISLTYEEHGFEAAKELAEKVIDEAYGYNYGPVLFKPTLTTGTQVFRPTREGALAYFVGGNPDFPNDKGFALKGWRKVEIDNASIYRSGNVAMTTGNVMITDKSGAITTVDKTWTFYKGKDRKLRIVSHHSSLPFTG
mmetsp:Transcript_36445/g.73471  ORF Transcript_36445/g.73471 Transcript_36445/m.73471 type:complete len:193 (+) Transcript_36445:95-673(+)